MDKDGLPIGPDFSSTDEYAEALLRFTTSTPLFQDLCGGVHILDFFIRQPDLYSSLLPQEWRPWFDATELSKILDYILGCRSNEKGVDSQCLQNSQDGYLGQFHEEGSAPPSLRHYIAAVKRLRLRRDATAFDDQIPQSATLPRHVSVGMKPKKLHEVQRFAHYIDGLATSLENKGQGAMQIVDFGSGQNYLGRTLVSPPYCRKVVAIESRLHNIEGARAMDVTARLTPKVKASRNNRCFRDAGPKGESKPGLDYFRLEAIAKAASETIGCTSRDANNSKADKIRYVEMKIEGGDLEHVLHEKSMSRIDSDKMNKSLVVSLHSCGNLVHHGLRSLIQNPSVTAVAMVGCCYNLMTERLEQKTYKTPSLRTSNPRLAQTSQAADPSGFPISRQLAQYQHERGDGIRHNITARMMACQAPRNWSDADCSSFFTRHFYRALLQRILHDLDLVKHQASVDSVCDEHDMGSTNSEAIIIGSLRKTCYTSFTAYVRGAASKLAGMSDRGAVIAQHLQDLSDSTILQYEERFASKKKELSTVWTLMAFSAELVEATIILDRWSFLREQECVEQCWVEPIFDYTLSPRNLIVVGLKKTV